MSWIVGCNIGLLIIAGWSFGTLVKEFNRSMFVGVDALYQFGGLMIPGAFAFLNLVLLFIFYPAYFWLSFLPLLIPLAIFIVLQVKNYRDGKEYDKFKKYGETFVHDARRFGVHLFEKDVRVQMKSNKKMEYVLNVYGDEQEEKIKPLVTKYTELAKAEFPDYQIQIFLNKKREARPHEKTA